MRDYVVVLNDGETYSSLEGCKVFRLPQGMDPRDADAVEDWIRDNGFRGIQVPNPLTGSPLRGKSKTRK